MSVQVPLDNAYETLCIPKDERSEFAVQTAYKALSKIFHPNMKQNKGDLEKAGKFQNVASARDCLKRAYNEYIGSVRTEWDRAMQKRNGYEKTLDPKIKEKLMKEYDDAIKERVRKAINEKHGLDNDEDGAKEPTQSQTKDSNRSNIRSSTTQAPRRLESGPAHQSLLTSSTLKALKAPGHVPSTSNSLVITQASGSLVNVSASDCQSKHSGKEHKARASDPPSSPANSVMNGQGATGNDQRDGGSQQKPRGDYRRSIGYISHEDARRQAGLTGRIAGVDYPDLHEFLTTKTVKAGIVERDFQKSLSFQTHIGEHALFSDKSGNSESTIEALQVSSTSQKASYVCFHGDKGSIPVLIMRGDTNHFMAFVPRNKDVHAAAIFDPEEWAATYLTAGKAKEKHIKYGPSARLTEKVSLEMVERYVLEVPRSARGSTERPKWTLNYGLPTDSRQAQYVFHYIDLRSDMEITVLQSDGPGELLRVATDAGNVIVLVNRDNRTKVFCLSGRGQWQRLACQYNDDNWAAAIIKEGDERIGKIRETGEVFLKDDDYVVIEQKVAVAKTATQGKASSSAKPNASGSTGKKAIKKRK